MPASATAQAKRCDFPSVIPFCIYPAERTLKSVSGRVADQAGAGVFDSCVTLFDKSNSPISRTSTDDEGNFSLNSIQSGRYLLVVGYPGFAPAIQAIRIRKRASGRKLKIIMAANGIDTCSIVH
jgi:hypothetical protein